MRLGLARQNHGVRRQALVLGEYAVAQHVAAALVEEGFEPIFPEILTSDPFPSVTDRNALNRIRSILSSFANLTQKTGIVHPTTSLWAERSELAGIARQLGLTIVSPGEKILSLFNNKLSFFTEADRLGIPHLVLSFDPIYTVREIEEFYRRLGHRFPFVLKTVKGAGSSSIFVVKDSTSFERSLPLWLEQVRWNVGEVVLFAERYLDGARLIKIPFVRFQGGKIEIFPFVDGSLQSRYRKVIEYCPAAKLDLGIEILLRQWTRKLITEWGYVGTGNLSFLVDGSRAFLIEGQTRLDTSFFLWEKVAETRAVSWQIAALKGDCLAITEKGLEKNNLGYQASKIDQDSGILLKIFAEDSFLHLPQPGVLKEIGETRTWNISGFQGNVFWNYRAGQNVPIHSSGLLGLLVVTGKDRERLPQITREVLEQLWVSGSIQTNEFFLSDVLTHPWVREEIFHAGFIDEEFLPQLSPPPQWTEVFRYLRDFYLKSISSLETSDGHLALVPPPPGSKWIEGPKFWDIPFQKEALVGGPIAGGLGKGISGQIEFQDLRKKIFRVMVFPLKDRCLVRIGPWFAGLRINSSLYLNDVKQLSEPSPLNPVTRGGLAIQSAEPSHLSLSALNAGRVHSVLYREGAQVPAHQPLLILEAFGIFVPHALPFPCKIQKWKIQGGSQVEFGQLMAELISI